MTECLVLFKVWQRNSRHLASLSILSHSSNIDRGDNSFVQHDPEPLTLGKCSLFIMEVCEHETMPGGTRVKGLTIGKLSKMAGVTNDTVRFYERCGLIDTAGRSESNYRVYREEDANRLRFIKRAKELGFSLNEIKELLALSQDPSATMADIRARTEIKAESIRNKIYDLSKILTALEHLAETCDGPGSARECPILKSLSDAGEAN